MTGPIFKGRQGYVLVSEEPYFDAETGTRYKDQTFAGSKGAIFGLANSLEAENISYRTSNNGPIYSLSCRFPFYDATVENLDRYEIATESLEKSIFEFPSVIEDAGIYDALLTSGQRTYREWAEESARTKLEDGAPAGSYPLQETVIRHLKNGVTGFQNDLIVLRRFRRIDLTYGYAGGKMNLNEGQLIYSTEQLQLPGDIAFVVPNTPANPSDDYAWGWKLRGQRVEIIGIELEQTVELLFAPWSTLLYESAVGNLDW